MFCRKLTEDLEIRLSLPQFAEELYQLTDDNRQFLKLWLPWLNSVQTAEDTKSFLQEQLTRFTKGEALHVSIFCQGKLAGVAGYNTIDSVNSIGHIGYWLGEAYNGNGIMTLVVDDLIKLGKEFYNLQRIDIRCATGNSKSRAIPERLGFINEGTLRRPEKVYDQWYDHEVYALLLD